MPRRTLPLIQRRPETDWAAVVDELRGYGCSLRGIGGALGLAHGNVQNWQRGSTPNFEDGRALLQLLERARAERGVGVIAPPDEPQQSPTSTLSAASLAAA
jgi:hypothetical protein